MKLSMKENSCKNIIEENKKLSAERTKLRNDAYDKFDKINKIAKDFDIKKKGICKSKKKKIKNNNKNLYFYLLNLDIRRISNCFIEKYKFKRKKYF